MLFSLGTTRNPYFWHQFERIIWLDLVLLNQTNVTISRVYFHL